MNVGKLTGAAPDWLRSYAGIILLVGVFVNLATGFVQSTHSLTIPSMRDSLGISYTQAGLMITTAGAVRMGAALAAGTLAPRYGSRYLIGAGTVATGMSMLLLGYSPSFLSALGAVSLMGLASGVALTPMMGLVAPWFQLRNRGLAAGLFASGGSLAIVVAALAVPWLIAQDPEAGWRHTWLIFGGLVLVIGASALVFLRDRPREPDRIQGITQTATQVRPSASRGTWPLAVYKNPLVWLISYLGFCSGLASGVFSTFFGAFLTDEGGVSLAVVGQLLLLVGALSVVSGIVWGRVSDRLGRGQSFGLSFFFQGVGFALFWLIPVMPAFIIGSVLLGLTMRAAFTLCTAASGDYVPAHFASAAFALVSVMAGLGSTLSPIISGVIADTVGISWIFSLGVGASLIGVVGSGLLRPGRTSAARDAVAAGD